jgi:hypothetical protein
MIGMRLPKKVIHRSLLLWQGVRGQNETHLNGHNLIMQYGNKGQVRCSEMQTFWYVAHINLSVRYSSACAWQVSYQYLSGNEVSLVHTPPFLLWHKSILHALMSQQILSKKQTVKKAV